MRVSPIDIRTGRRTVEAYGEQGSLAADVALTPALLAAIKDRLWQSTDSAGDSRYFRSLSEGIDHQRAQ